MAITLGDNIFWSFEPEGVASGNTGLTCNVMEMANRYNLFDFGDRVEELHDQMENMEDPE